MKVKEAMSKHTPGPWTLAQIHALAWVVTQKDNGIERDIATVTTSDANAHLIAAAPEMYAALRTYGCSCFDCQRAIDEVLAKAEGTNPKRKVK